MENKLVFAAVKTAQVTTKTLDGRAYLVAPVVAVRAGVLNFELVPADEIQKSVNLWNDVPVPVNHPLHNDEKISARDVSIIEQAVVGRFYNAYYEDDALKGELWIDIEKAKKVGGDALVALEKLQQGQPLEVSTAYYSDVSDENGSYKGISYEGIQYNLRPDHLALLPASIGACSWQGGCGAPRVNEEGDCMPQLKVALREGESYEMRMEAVDGAIKAAVKPEADLYIYIADLFEDSVVYRISQPDDKSSYFKAAYTLDSNGKVILGDAVQVERKVEYTTLKANVRGTTRKPSYKGTESTAWTGPTLSKMIAGYVKNTGKAKPESSLVKDLPADVKTWIASKTLLGEATADNERDLMFFPVVNPSTNKLNEGALRAVLGGRGAQADIPATARDSARAKARSLLEKEFGMETQEAKLGTKLINIFKELLGVRTMDKDQMVATLQERGVELEELEKQDEKVLAWMLDKTKPVEGQAPQDQQPPDDEEEDSEEENTQEQENPPEANEAIGTKVDEYLKAKGIDLTKMAAQLKAQEDATAKEKQAIVGALVANEKCTIGKQFLEAMELDVLKQLSAAYEPGSYLGVGVPHQNIESVPAPPPVVLAKKGGE